MESPFEHKIMSDLSSETRWLKYFPSKVFASAIIKLSVPLMAFYINGLTKLNIILAAVFGTWAIVWAMLSIAERSTRKYLKGGGYKFSDLYLKKLHFKITKRRYVLAVNRQREQAILENNRRGL